MLAVPVWDVELDTGVTFTPLASTLPVSRSVNVTVAAVIVPPTPGLGSETLAVSVTCAVVLLDPEVTNRVWPI